MKRLLLSGLLLLACGDNQTTDPDTDTDTDTDADTDTDVELNPDDYFGKVPDEPKGLPSFTALNYDNTERGPADLQGHPTVVWFFPFADSPG